jgi:hypothetical protein
MFETTLFEIVSATLFALALIHGIRKYNPRRLLVGLAVVAVMMITEENVAMVLSNDYTYGAYHLWVGRLPVAIALDWLVVVYLGFQVSAAIKSRLEIFLWRGKHSNSKSVKVVNFATLGCRRKVLDLTTTSSLLPSLLGALIASSVDLILEPVAYYWGLWTWSAYSPVSYFNAPIHNFGGWFFFTLIGVLVLDKLCICNRVP